MNFVKSATSEGLADSDGVPHNDYLKLYRQIAQNKELSIIITGHIAVSRESRPEPNCIYLTDGEHYPFKLRSRNLARTVQEVKKTNPNVKFLAQLNHGGRQIPRVQLIKNRTSVVCSTLTGTFKNSMLLFKAPNCHPSNKKYVFDQFLFGAKQMRNCGFDGVQIHCAHGYLLHDVLVTDYQLVVQLLQNIREEWPTCYLSVKVNGEERFLKFLEEAVKIADLVEISAGSYEDPKKMVDNHVQKYSCQFVRGHQELRQQKAKICITGGFYTKDEAQSVIMQDVTDFVGFGRLYCLAQQTIVNRLKFPTVVKAIAKLVPLANAGPATIFYEETLRRRAKGIAFGNEKEEKRIGVVWWMWTMILWLLGQQRYCTKRDMLDKKK